MSEAEDYVGIDCWIVRRTDDAVLIRVGAWDAATQAWIPRTVLYGPDEKVMSRAAAGARMTLRMFAWKAKEQGLLSETDTTAAAQSNLFDAPT